MYNFNQNINYYESAVKITWIRLELAPDPVDPEALPPRLSLRPDLGEPPPDPRSLEQDFGLDLDRS